MRGKLKFQHVKSKTSQAAIETTQQKKLQETLCRAGSDSRPHHVYKSKTIQFYLIPALW